MIRLLLALALLWAPAAHAQNIMCPTRAPGNNSNACASTAFVGAASSASIPATSNVLKGSGSAGSALAATPGTDYITPAEQTSALATALPSQTNCQLYTGTGAAGVAGAAVIGTGLNCASGTLSVTGVSAWSNTRLAKTGAYTVGSGDIGDTIALGGSGFYTLTFNAASGYASNFCVMALNEDTGRGKLIAPNGLTSFILWPLQTVFVCNQNNTWQLLPYAQRWKIPGAVTVYVDNVNGNDGNDCLAVSTGACATPNGAMKVISKQFDYNNQTVLMQMTAGQTYTNLSGPVLGLLGGVGNGALVVDGGTTGYFQSTAAGYDAIDTQGNVPQGVVIQNIALSATGAGSGFDILAQNAVTIQVGSGIVFGTAVGGQIGAQDNGTIVQLIGNYTINGGASCHYNAADGGSIIQGASLTVTLTGTPAFSTAFACAYSLGDYYVSHT